MPTLKPTQPAVPQIVPTGKLRHLTTREVIPSNSNPRHLFDPEQLLELKNNIGEHGVLVPITVYQAKGQAKFSILDGERRYRCVVELEKEGHAGKAGGALTLPANVVEPPTKIAGLLYMFSIHNYREGWELMPTALGLKIVMEDLGTTDNKALVKLTGLSEPQIERCKKLLKFPEKFQEMSLDLDPKTRIPSNFWIEALPVLDLALETSEQLKKLGRDRSTEKLVDKYRNKKIKSVIHFRRIMEAYDLWEDDAPTRAKVLRRVEEFFLKPDLETRDAFDEFVVEKKRVQNALTACEEFLSQLRKYKLTYTTNEDERSNLRKALHEVQAYCESLEHALEGSDDPEAQHD
ncbi:MAG TPA: ParB N-terminal domain-containing protein [Bryobacteraceae bacterium]|nr:ParB N-terminal domain-containing protein [Bryobacteraceae bacterium]